MEEGGDGSKSELTPYIPIRIRFYYLYLRLLIYIVPLGVPFDNYSLRTSVTCYMGR